MKFDKFTDVCMTGGRGITPDKKSALSCAGIRF